MALKCKYCVEGYLGFTYDDDILCSFCGTAWMKRQPPISKEGDC